MNMMRPRDFVLFVVLAIGSMATATAQTAHPSHDSVSHTAGTAPADCPFRAAGESLSSPSSALPTSPGQDAFGAIAEIVALLEQDPTTDWALVSIDRLRDHLVDMNELTLRARTRQRSIDGGLEIEVTGEGATRDSIQRMVPAHARMMRTARRFTIDVETIEAGVKLVLTSDDPHEVAKLRGLGFFGFMASGDHHQPHHLAMARGAMPH